MAEGARIISIAFKEAPAACSPPTPGSARPDGPPHLRPRRRVEGVASFYGKRRAGMRLEKLDAVLPPGDQPCRRRARGLRAADPRRDARRPHAVHHRRRHREPLGALEGPAGEPARVQALRAGHRGPTPSTSSSRRTPGCRSSGHGATARSPWTSSGSTAAAAAGSARSGWTALPGRSCSRPASSVPSCARRRGSARAPAASGGGGGHPDRPARRRAPRGRPARAAGSAGTRRVGVLDPGAPGVRGAALRRRASVAVERTGRSASAQAFALGRKILEVDTARAPAAEPRRRGPPRRCPSPP